MDLRLGHIMAKRSFAKQNFKINYSQAPHIYFIRNQSQSSIETLRSLVPISSNSLRSQLDLVFVLINLFTQAEIAELNLSIVEENILRFEVEMDHFCLLCIEVSQSVQNLKNNEAGFLFWDLAVASQVFSKIRSRTKFKNCTKAIIVDLNCVNLLYYSWVMQVFVDFCLSNGISHISHLLSFRPMIVKSVNFQGNLFACFKIKSPVDF